MKKFTALLVVFIATACAPCEHDAGYTETETEEEEETEMRVIHKYSLGRHVFEETRAVTIPMPPASVVLSVDNQYNTITLWANVLVEGDDAEPHVFYVVPTGGNVPNNGVYLGTVMLDEGTVVGHIYQGVT